MLGQLRKREQRGFTLIELLIIIIILGILAAIVVSAIGGTRHDSITARCRTDVRAVDTSAEAIHVKTSAYPTDPSDFFTAGNGNMLKDWPNADEYGLDWDGSQVEVYGSQASGAPTM